MLATLALLATLATTVPAGQTLKQDPRMDWWREARFGMFIHWGLYSIPAGKWGDSTNHAEWILTTAQIPVRQYEKFKDQFNPVKFDADEICRIAKDAGMKYIVITTKHHDGFALFDSKVSDYDVMATPFKRDIMKELAEACRRHGLKMCWYHSIMDWHHPDYLPRRAWEDRTAEGADFKRYFEYLKAQVTELLTNYGDIGIMWFDGEWESTWTHEYGKELYELCRKLQPNVIVNNRVDVWRDGMAGLSKDDHAYGDYGTPEQEVPATGLPGVDWETCMTMNGHWGYNAADHNFKTTKQLIQLLSDIASKGGNFLLNVGPTAEGLIPPTSVERLKEMGAWMRDNGEAIYGTSASPFKSLPWGRATMKNRGADTTLYLHVFDWPTDGRLKVSGLGNQVRGARLLGTFARLAARQKEGEVEIEIPTRAPDPNVSVIALDLVGKPVIYAEPIIDADAAFFVRSLPVSVSAGEGLEVRVTVDGSTPTASSPLAKAPLTIDRTTTVKARAFHNGKPVTGVVERRFEKVTPKPAAPGAGLMPGLTVETFAGDWDKVPDFGALKPEGTSVEPVVGLDPLKTREHYGRRIRGYVVVPADDVYTFFLASDDGSRLLVDGKLVVDNDGLHSMQENSGAVALAAGPHAIEIGYFNKTGGAELKLALAPLGQKPVPVAAGALKHK
ncbi:MAG: alpha-L-fucosidase [Chthonomonadaceae bacterium]|nr:alpha-L-fucosidase [Chthonomonadaceae bacterium]